MNRRLLLVVLLVVSTAAFVVGVSVERSSGDSHDEPAVTAASSEAAESDEEHADERAEGEASESADEAHSEGAGEAGQDEDESLLGVDLEATPFVVLAAAASLGLAVAVWLRPGWRPLLGLVAAVMVAFAALDVREVVHQVDEHNGGLAALAGVVAALHLAAAAIALSMGRSPALAPRDSLASLPAWTTRRRCAASSRRRSTAAATSLDDERFASDMTAWVRGWFAAFRRSFPDIRMEPVQVVAEGDTVAGRFACSATHPGDWRRHPPTGRRIEDVDEVYFFTFDGARISAAWGVEDTLDRFQQLGIDPSVP